jgi:hypothetical protein
MALPKKSSLRNTYPSNVGIVRIEELLNQTDENSTFLPQSIDIADLDMAVFTCVNEGDLSLSILTENDERVKVDTIFMNNERWGEFQKTWHLQDENKNIVPPFITMERTNILKGTIYGDKFNIPNKKTFTYYKIPIIENDSLTYIHYKITQPSAINIEYDVRLITAFITDVNEIVELYLNKFNERQLYIDINGHYMQLNLEDIISDSTLNDLEGKRYYVKSFKLVLKAYLIKKSDFQIIKAPTSIINKFTNNNSDLFSIKQDINTPE